MPITTTPQSRLGAWLLERFREHGWESYRQAANYTGVSHTQLRTYVAGAVPTPPVLVRLATFFGVSRAELDELLGRAELRQTEGGVVVQTPSATMRIDDPRLASLVFSRVSRWQRMTEEERQSTYADETDIPERPVAEWGGDDAPSGGKGARGPTALRDHRDRD